MRSLIRELPYERLIASGHHRYERDGRPTGTVEKWRLTSAVDDYRFLRVDQDGQANDGESALFHLTVSGDGRPERLAFRFWGASRRISGNVLLDAQSATLAYSAADDRQEKTIRLDDPSLFLFPTALGHLLTANIAAGHVSLATLSGGERPDLSAMAVPITVGTPEVREIARHRRRLQPWHIGAASDRRTVWFDEHLCPLVVTWPMGMTAVATRYFRHD